MLTLSKTNKPLAIATSGKTKGAIIYYTDADNKPKSLIRKKMDTEIESQFSKLFKLPTLSERECIYITGPSGSGKSSWICEYTKYYMSLFPNNDVYLFSNLVEDKAFKDIEKDIERVPIDENLITQPITIDDVVDSLVIFDDVDNMKDKDVEKALTDLQNDLLLTGRHSNTHVLISKHMALDYFKTRTVLNECHGVVVYPKGGNTHIVRNLLKLYCGLSKEQIDKILKLSSRWVYVNKAFPNYVLCDNKIYLL